MPQDADQSQLNDEVQRLLTETSRQYEEYLRLAKLADISKLAMARAEAASPLPQVSLQLVFPT